MRRLNRLPICNASLLPYTTYLPLAFLQVNIYRRDYRRRRLGEIGLGKDLICTLRFQRMRRIKSPDIIGATVHVTGKWRIAWNRAWLQTWSENGDDVT